MNPIQLLQAKLNLKPDGIIGRLTYGAFRMHFNLTPIQLAHLLGQCAHETGQWRYWEENLRYSSAALIRTWPGRYTIDLAARHELKPSVIANHVYGGRMGNTQPNDGWHFRGRGAIQLTGRDNYTRFSQAMKDTSILTAPDQLLSKYAMDTAVWYFNQRNLFAMAEDLSEKTILNISRAINIGNPFSNATPKGLDDRIRQTLTFKKFIT